LWRLRVHLDGNFRNAIFLLLRPGFCGWTQQQTPFGKVRQKNNGQAKSKMRIADSRARKTLRNAKARENTASSDYALVKVNSLQERRFNQLQRRCT